MFARAGLSEAIVPRSIRATLIGFLLVAPSSHGQEAAPAAEGAAKPVIRLVFPRPDLPQPAHEISFGSRCRTDPDALRELGPQAAVTPPRAPKTGLKQPDYPASARRARKEGTTTLLVLVNENGDVVKAVVEYSSGHRELDQSALDGTRKWHFTAPTLHGAAHCAWGRFATTFKVYDGEPEPLIHPEAQRLANILLGNYRLTSVLENASLLQGSAANARVVTETTQGLMFAPAFRSVYEEYAGLLSANVSREHLASIAAFYETLAGAKWLRVHAGIDRAVSERFSEQLGSVACRVFMAQRSLVTKPQPDAASDALPAEFRQALPKILAASEEFCACAAVRFAQSLGVSDAAGRDKLIAEAQADGCKRPEDVKW